MPSRQVGAIPNHPEGPRHHGWSSFYAKAIEWQALLKSGEIANQAGIAKREGVTRARVTQIMGMLRLGPEIQEQILSMPDAVHRPPITERMLRPIATITDYRDQLIEFHRFLG